MPNYRFEEDHPLSSSLYAAIGEMVVQWGHLEDLAGIVTALLLKTDHFDFRGAAVNLATNAKFQTLSAIATLKLPPRKAATLRRIAEDARKKSAERNRIIHGSWYWTINPDVAERFSYTARGQLVETDETVSAARVRGFTREIAHLRRPLNRAMSREGFYRS
jgi:hypothetical protein